MGSAKSDALLASSGHKCLVERQREAWGAEYD